MRQTIQTVKDLITWGGPVGVLILAFLFSQNLIFSLVLGLLVFGGLFFILNPRSAVEETREEIRDEVARKLADVKTKLALIRFYGRDIPKIPVRNQIMRICDLADQTIAELSANQETPLLTAARLETTFGLTEQVVKLYSGIYTGKLSVEPEKREAIAAKIESNLLNEIGRAHV